MIELLGKIEMINWWLILLVEGALEVVATCLIVWLAGGFKGIFGGSNLKGRYTAFFHVMGAMLAAVGLKDLANVVFNAYGQGLDYLDFYWHLVKFLLGTGFLVIWRIMEKKGKKGEKRCLTLRWQV